MRTSIIDTANKQILKVYAARTYNKWHPCTGYVEINVPEYLPSTPQNNGTEQFGLNKRLFANTNYPAISKAVNISHSITLKILQGTEYSRYFSKGTEFLLLTPSGEIEDGYLIMI